MEAMADTYIKGKTSSAQKIPYWLWLIIAKILGIKLKPNEKPIISSVLHVLTFGSAAALFCTILAYEIQAVISNNTKSDILDGTVSVMVFGYFCGLGVYSHRLGYRLFVHPKFLDMLRLHSKSIMKINAVFLIFLILSGFVVTLNIASVQNIYSYQDNSTIPGNNTNNMTDSLNPCQVAHLNVGICQTYWISQVIFSVFFLVWNLLVAVVLVSVARTQTINIRKFLRELEHDALLLDGRLRTSYGEKPMKEDLKNLVWSDDDQLADVFQESRMKEEVGVLDNRVSRTDTLHQRGSISGLSEPSPSLGSEGSRRESNITTSTEGSGFQPLDTIMDQDNDSSFTPHVLSEQEIMHKYWRISMNVRLASVALQRWMSSIIGLITTWSAIRMVFWLSHTPNWYGVFMFVIPLLLLPLLATSYAEVNYEGEKVIQSILPTEKRVFMFQYLYGHPIKMTVYGHAISYGTIGTVVAGILAAFASKILLQEMSSL